MDLKFKDRHEAGMALAKRLMAFKNNDNVIILGLPRGGVIIAYEIAHILKVPFDIFIVMKIGHPEQPELAIGAIAQNGHVYLDESMIKNYSLSKDDLQPMIQIEQKEIERRNILYRKGRNILSFKGKIVVVVDDGIATGATMKASLLTIRKLEPQRLIAAVPVGEFSSCNELEKFADETYCLKQPESFFAVGFCYENFEQISDEEVKRILSKE